jgi:hypothetical protein
MAEGFLNWATIESAIVPIDLATGANDGDWVSLENYHRCVCVLIHDAGTAGQDPVFKLQQATDSAGSGAKDLTFTVIHEKVGATALTGVTAWTRTTQTAATSYTNAAAGENEAIQVVEVSSDELDVANGFKFLQLSVADPGATAGIIGVGIYILYEPRFPKKSPLSALS